MTSNRDHVDAFLKRVQDEDRFNKALGVRFLNTIFEMSDNPRDAMLQALKSVEAFFEEDAEQPMPLVTKTSRSAAHSDTQTGFAPKPMRINLESASERNVQPASSLVRSRVVSQSDSPKVARPRDHPLIPMTPSASTLETSPQPGKHSPALKPQPPPVLPKQETLRVQPVSTPPKSPPKSTKQPSSSPRPYQEPPVQAKPSPRTSLQPHRTSPKPTSSFKKAPATDTKDAREVQTVSTPPKSSPKPAKQPSSSPRSHQELSAGTPVQAKLTHTRPKLSEQPSPKEPSEPETKDVGAGDQPPEPAKPAENDIERELTKVGSRLEKAWDEVSTTTTFDDSKLKSAYSELARLYKQTQTLTNPSDKFRRFVATFKKKHVSQDYQDVIRFLNNLFKEVIPALKVHEERANQVELVVNKMIDSIMRAFEEKHEIDTSAQFRTIDSFLRVLASFINTFLTPVFGKGKWYDKLQSKGYFKPRSGSVSSFAAVDKLKQQIKTLLTRGTQWKDLLQRWKKLQPVWNKLAKSLSDLKSLENSSEDAMKQWNEAKGTFDNVAFFETNKFEDYKTLYTKLLSCKKDGKVMIEETRRNLEATEKKSFSWDGRFFGIQKGEMPIPTIPCVHSPVEDSALEQMVYFWKPIQEFVSANKQFNKALDESYNAAKSGHDTIETRVSDLKDEMSKEDYDVGRLVDGLKEIVSITSGGDQESRKEDREEAAKNFSLLSYDVELKRVQQACETYTREIDKDLFESDDSNKLTNTFNEIKEMKDSSYDRVSWTKQKINAFLDKSKLEVDKLLELVQPKLVDKYLTNTQKWNQNITLNPPPGGGETKDDQYEARRLDLTCLINYLNKLKVKLEPAQEEELQKAKDAIEWVPPKEETSWGLLNWLPNWGMTGKK
jgi:hypothetical protein